MKAFLLIFVFFHLGYHSQGQNTCVADNFLTIKETLTECLGKDWYQKFKSDQDNKIYMKVISNKDGKIIEIEEHLLYRGITKKEYKKFSQQLIRDKRFCVYNPEPEISFEKYLEINQGRLPYKIIFIPFLFEKSHPR